MILSKRFIITLNHILLLLLVLVTLKIDFINGLLQYSNKQNTYYNSRQQPTARWCTTSVPEEMKCNAMLQAFTAEQLTPRIECVSAANTRDCMRKISLSEADMMTLKPNDIYTAGVDYGLVPILGENYHKTLSSTPYDHYSVAVTWAEYAYNINLRSLKGTKSCHTSINDYAGWKMPISYLISEKIMSVYDCNNELLSAAHFFSESCLPGVLNQRFNPTDAPISNLCGICEKNTNFCKETSSSVDEESFKCLAQRRGNVAFLRHDRLIEIVDRLGINRNYFRLLCRDGHSKGLTEYKSCNIGLIPASAVVTRSLHPLTIQFQTLFIEAQRIFGPPNQQWFQLFNSSSRLRRKNVLFHDKTLSLIPTEFRNNYISWLGRDYLTMLNIGNTCPVSVLRWCAVSNVEMDKCSHLKISLEYRRLKPELACVRGRDALHCMHKLSLSSADVTSFEVGDIFMAGKLFDLGVILREKYYDGSFNKYLVAVSKKDHHKLLSDLYDESMCLPGILGEAWAVLLNLLSHEDTGLMTDECISAQLLGDYLGPSCVPGSQSPDYNKNTTNPVSLCETCSGSDELFCERNTGESYYGNVGAVKCVAQSTHINTKLAITTADAVIYNTIIKERSEWNWALMEEHLQYICKNGLKEDIVRFAPQECSLAVLPSRGVIARRDLHKSERSIYQQLFLYADIYSDTGDSETMFNIYSSANENSFDLMFSNSAVSLHTVSDEDGIYNNYISKDLLDILEQSYEWSTQCPYNGNIDSTHTIVTLTLTLTLVAIVIAQ